MLGINMETEYIEVLRCPICKGELKVIKDKMNKKTEALKCLKCGELYNIKRNIPILFGKK